MLKKSPDSILIVSIILCLFILLTWLIPAGEYLREVKDGRTIVVAGTYQEVNANPQGLGDLLIAPIKGLVSASHIIAFVLLVGGAFSIITATGAVDAGLQQILTYAKKNPAAKHFIVPGLMLIFSLAGCTFGMSEEVLVFILITLPLAKSMGYDPIVGIAIPFIGASAGFAGAAVNPFTVGIAQGIAELPIFSGAGYRWFVWIIYTSIAIAFVMWYIRKLEKNPSISPIKNYQQDIAEIEEVEKIPFTINRKIIILLFCLSIIVLMYGANQLGWYIDEISALFLALGIICAIISQLNIQQTINSFTSGAKDMLTAAIIIGLSKSILVVAEDGKIIDTILYHVAGTMEGLPNYVSVQLMFFVQGFINIFIPSGSGQAAITMPVMTPLADIIGVSRQSAVLAFQFGDGLLNMIIPTSGVTMGVLSIAKVPYNIWVKWIWKLIVLLTLVSMVLLAIPETIYTWPQ